MNDQLRTLKHTLDALGFIPGDEHEPFNPGDDLLSRVVDMGLEFDFEQVLLLVGQSG